MQISAAENPRGTHALGDMDRAKAQRGERLLPSPASWHCVKSIGSPHLPHLWGRSNSSEKISFSVPHFGQLQVKDFRVLKLA
jgi:hypothetical protein